MEYQRHHNMDLSTFDSSSFRSVHRVLFRSFIHPSSCLYCCCLFVLDWKHDFRILLIEKNNKNMNQLVNLNKCRINKFRNHINLLSPTILASPKCLPKAPNFYVIREMHSQKRQIRSTLNYMIALGVMTVGLSYAAVPLYRIFCQVSI